MADDQKESTSVGSEGQPQPNVGAVLKEAEGAEVSKVEEGKAAAPTVRTYSEEEWNNRQSTIDKNTVKVKEDFARQLQEGQDALNQALIDAEEIQYKGFLGQVDGDGGDMDAAKAIVEKQRTVATSERAMKTREAAVAVNMAKINSAEKNTQASSLIEEHSLPKDSLVELLEAKDPTDMENRALKLRVTKTKADEKPANTVDSGQGTGGQRDIKSMNPITALGTLMEDEK